MRIRGILKVSAVVFAVSILLPLASFSATGFYIGAGGGAAFPLGWDDFEPEDGGNLEYIYLGYNFDGGFGLALRMGVAAGTADDETESAGGIQVKFEDLKWSQSYVSLTGRYNFDVSETVVPYLETGLGIYQYRLEGDVSAMGLSGDFEGEFDPTLGYQVVVGSHFYIGNFFIAPELAYHAVTYYSGEIEADIGGVNMDEDIDDASGANMMVLQVKAGYHFK